MNDRPQDAKPATAPVAGFDRHVVKPMPRETLDELIVEAARRRSLKE